MTTEQSTWMCPAPSDLNNLDQGAGNQFSLLRSDACTKRCSVVPTLIWSYLEMKKEMNSDET